MTKPKWKKKVTTEMEPPEPWLSLVVSTHDKTRAKQLLKERYHPDELDHTDDFKMHDIVKDIIDILAVEQVVWKQLTPSKQVHTVKKYSSLHDWVTKLAQDLQPSTPVRNRSGRKPPGNPPPFADRAKT